MAGTEFVYDKEYCLVRKSDDMAIFVNKDYVKLLDRLQVFSNSEVALPMDEEVRVCVETGSFLGVGALTFSKFFDKVYSMEISKSLHDDCVSKWTKAEEDSLVGLSDEQTQGPYSTQAIAPNITFLHGASTDLLPDVVKEIKCKYFLFLDAHGSGGKTEFDSQVGRWGSPVLEELECVKDNPPEWIVIDDIDGFDKLDDYPTKEMIIEKVKEVGEYEKPITVNNEEIKKEQFFCFKRKK